MKFLFKNQIYKKLMSNQKINKISLKYFKNIFLNKQNKINK